MVCISSPNRTSPLHAVLLAEASGISEISIKNIERGETDPRSTTLGAIQAAFMKAGVVFLDPGDIRDGGHGVRLVKR